MSAFNFKLTDLINVGQTQQLLQKFMEMVGVPAAIIDLDGVVLVTSPWQKVCTDFHRQNETTCARCIESDTILANELLEGKTFSFYRCLNGLTDAASPIIIEGNHLANAFIGQFFTEEPDLDFFSCLADEYGFDKSVYFESLSVVPIISKETLPVILSFLTSFAEMIASLGLQQLRQLEIADELRRSQADLQDKNEELSAIEEELRSQNDEMLTSRERIEFLSRFPDENPNPVLRIGMDGIILYANRASSELWGAWEVGSHISWFLDFLSDDTLKKGVTQSLEVAVLDRFFLLTVVPIEEHGYVNIYGNEITERKLAEMRQALTTDILCVLSDSGDLHSRLATSMELIQRESGFDAVGLRLRVGDDCPYFEQKGFSEEFLVEENFLCERRGDGRIIRDADGKPVLECTCGLVLSGRTDPAMACFTQGGSFWTNASEELLALPSEADPRTEPRNRCIHTGYQSVGLFPVRAGQEIVGLLQLNDHRGGRFTPELILFYEWLAQNIGLAVQRAAAEEALQKAHGELELRVQERTAELVNANALLREQARQVDAFFAHSSSPLVFLDPDLNFIRVNKAYAKTCGRRTDEFIGRNHFEMYPSEELEGKFRQVVETREPYRIYGRPFIFPDHPERGTTYWDLSVQPILKEDGEVDFLVFSLDDVTEQKEAELAIRESERELRTYANRLEFVNKELEEFAFVASHDLQEPLRKIHTFCDMAQKRCAPVLDSTSMEYLDRVANSATRMRTLLNDLLQYSRVAGGPQPFQEVDISKIVSETSEVFEQQIKETGARIEIMDLPKIEADGSQMTRLFQNLIGNALKFRGDPKPLIKIYGECKGHFCDILVEDNGIGFEQQYAERIFRPFQRLHGRKEFEGSGMGLAICRKIAERHGGNIRAQGEPGKGAKFVVRLPRRQEKIAGTA